MATVKRYFFTGAILAVLLLIWSVPGFTQAPSWQDQYGFGSLNNYRESNRLNREATVARENYCPTGGCVIRLDSVTVKPPVAQRGQTLLLSTSYTLLTPEGVAIPVAITREIFFQGKSLGRTKSIESRRQNGVWDQQINFTLPADAAPGEYTLLTKVSTGYGQSEKSTQFRVER
jgi:hypothetical protein